MKSTQCDGDARGTKRASDVEGTRILVGLNTNESNQSEIICSAKQVEQVGHVDARIGLVNRLNGNRNVRPQDLALGAISSYAVNGGERIRWNHRAPPPDNVSVVVVVRRLDQDELEASSRHTQNSDLRIFHRNLRGIRSCPCRKTAGLPRATAIVSAGRAHLTKARRPQQGVRTIYLSSLLQEMAKAGLCTTSPARAR